MHKVRYRYYALYVYCCFVMIIIRLIFLESLNCRSTSRTSLYVGIRASIRRKLSTIFGDCNNAVCRQFSIVRDPLPEGLFISHKTPAILISGVRVLARRAGTKNTTSKPSLSAKKSAVIFSCLSGKTPGGIVIVPVFCFIMR